MTTKFLRLKTVQDWTGLSRSTIYAMQANGSFPASISIGLRAIAWASSDVEAWIESRISESKLLEQSSIKEAKNDL
jgi:prophage regulatory protein